MVTTFCIYMFVYKLNQISEIYLLVCYVVVIKTMRVGTMLTKMMTTHLRGKQFSLSDS